MTEFLFPFADESQGYGYSPEDRAAIELLCNAVEEIDVLPRHPPDHLIKWNGRSIEPNQIATDTLVDLDGMQ